MKDLEEQLNDLIAQSDRVSAELNHEVFLIGRADAAINYLRTVREQTAVQVAALLEQRAVTTIPPFESQRKNGHANGHSNGHSNGYGEYDPNWPN